MALSTSLATPIIQHEVPLAPSLSQLIAQQLCVWNRGREPPKLALSKIAHFYSSHPEIHPLTTLARRNLLVAKIISAFPNVVTTGVASSSSSENDVSLGSVERIVRVIVVAILFDVY